MHILNSIGIWECTFSETEKKEAVTTKKCHTKLRLHRCKPPMDLYHRRTEEIRALRGNVKRKMKELDNAPRGRSRKLLTSVEKLH